MYRTGISLAGLSLASALFVRAGAAQSDTTRRDSVQRPLTWQDSLRLRRRPPSAGLTQDTIRRAQVVSDMRIPVRKDGMDPGASAGAFDRSYRVDSLSSLEAAYRARLDTITTTLGDRVDATDRRVAALLDSMRAVHRDLATARAELAGTRTEVATLGTRTIALGDSLSAMSRSYQGLRNGSVFGHSGFYVGLGTGANLTSGALRRSGYYEGLNITIPIGFQRPGSWIGLRSELGLQTFDGRPTSTPNPDPEMLSAIGMLTVHAPLSEGGRSSFYLMGGGGSYTFRDYGTGSALAGFLQDGNAARRSERVTKWGVTGGAGLEWHVLGATSLFVESRLTNVFADASSRPGAPQGSNLRWVPIIVGMQLR